MSSSEITVSVVIPAYNAETTLGDCLESVIDIDYPKKHLKVIVIDDGSKDNTANIISNYNNVKLIRNPVNRGTSQAKNQGIAVASGKVVAFLDADSAAPKEWLHVVLPFLEKKGIAAVGVGQKPICARPDFLDHLLLLGRFHFRGQHTKDIVLQPPERTEIVENIFNAGAVFLRDALLDVDGFDESITSGEDLDICWRLGDAGWKILLVGDTAVKHHVKSDLVSFSRKQFWYGMGLPAMWRRHPKRFPAVPLMYGVLIITIIAVVTLALHDILYAMILTFSLATIPFLIYLLDLFKARGKSLGWKITHLVIGYVKTVSNVLGAIRAIPTLFSHQKLLDFREYKSRRNRK
jgi:GT2 family glycosyltransferase